MGGQGVGGAFGRRGELARAVRRVLVCTIAGAALAATARPAAAQNLEQYDYANLGVRAIGAELIYVDPTQNESTLGFGARLDLGFLGPAIRVVPRFGYWKADVDGESVSELERQIEEVSELEPGTINLGSIQRSAYILGADFEYIATVSRVSPYIGVGLDVYALNDDGNAIAGTFLDDLVVTAGVSAVGGLQVAINPQWSAFGEFRATAVTDASSLGASFGILYTFGL